MWLPSEEEGGYTDPVKGLSGLAFVDHEDGLEIRPAAGHDFVIKPGHLGIQVPKVGSLNIVPAEDSLAQIPAWSGRSIDVGEVWQVVYDPSEPVGESTYFTMVTPTAVATLFPDRADPTGKFTKELTFIAGLGQLSLQ